MSFGPEFLEKSANDQTSAKSNGGGSISYTTALVRNFFRLVVSCSLAKPVLPST